jgi:serum response factor
MSSPEKAQKNAPRKKGKHVSVATRTTISQSKKFSAAGQPAGSTSTNMLGENRYAPNPTNADPFAPSLAPYPEPKNNMDNDERSSVSDTDDTALAGEKPLPAPGKKTRGRVRIQMEYIQNKLRRYTTFSKRKSGMMKKVFFRSDKISRAVVGLKPAVSDGPFSTPAVFAFSAWFLLRSL